MPRKKFTIEQAFLDLDEIIEQLEKDETPLNDALALYTEGMKLVKNGGYLATCSCSHFMDPQLFARTIREAAAGAHKYLRQVEFHTQAPDHPILWTSDESYYLKFYIFQVV